MSIDHKTADAALKRLQAEHQRIRYSDPAKRATTEELIAALDRQLRHPDPQKTQGQLVQRAQKAVEAFEVDHPKLAAAIVHIIDLLSGMGV